MGRITLVTCFLLAIAVYAHAQLPAPLPVPVPPLHGVVTLVEPYGQFYLNLGSCDQLYRGAQLTIFRYGQPLASAIVFKVDRQDAIAQLPPAFRAIRLESGDKVVVTCNPIPCIRPPYQPYVEPDTRWVAFDTTYSLVIVTAVAFAIFN